MSRARGRQRRYKAAVRRQIAMVDAWDNATQVERRSMALPAPVADFLRTGDTAELGIAACAAAIRARGESL